MEEATFGGGCFWCLEAAFAGVKGVHSARSGYSGGSVPNPGYEQVCSGRTGHAEVVRLAFDPAVVSYRELLAMFFALHDPTTLNRQGNDIGTQYRSVIFCHTAEQRQAAEAVIAELNAAACWPSLIVTELQEVAPFYVAEPYHQGYYARNPGQGYCVVVIEPKLAHFRASFADHQE